MEFHSFLPFSHRGPGGGSARGCPLCIAVHGDAPRPWERKVLLYLRSHGQADGRWNELLLLLGILEPGDPPGPTFPGPSPAQHLGPSLSPEELQGAGRGVWQGVVQGCGSPVGRALGVSENAAEQKVKEEKH